MTFGTVRLSRLLSENALFKNTLTLISGTVATQAIVFLFSPVLSRIFHLEDFGDLANYNAWAAILVMLSNFRYEQAVLVAKGREQTNQTFVLSALLSFASCMGYALIGISIYSFYTGGGYVAELRRIVLFIPFGVLAQAVASLFMQYNVKTGSFKLLAGAATAQVFFTVGPQIILGLLHVRNALIIGTTVGFVFAAIVFARFYFKDHTLAELRTELRLTQLKTTARQHVSFPRYMLAADTISAGVQQFVPVFVLALFDPAVAGLYAFSVRVVRVPMIVISAALTGALRKEAVDHVHSGKPLARLFAGTVRSLVLLSLVPFLITLLFGRQLFGIVFGHQWIEAGRIVQILSPGILVEFIALPLSAFFLATNTQHYTFAVQSIGFALLVAALFIGKHVLHDFMGTCYLVCGTMIVVNALTILLAARVSGNARRQEAIVAT